MLAGQGLPKTETRSNNSVTFFVALYVRNSNTLPDYGKPPRKERRRIDTQKKQLLKLRSNHSSSERGTIYRTDGSFGVAPNTTSEALGDSR
jgi:hypothetical protein